MASLRRDEDSGPHGGPVVAPFRIWHFLLCYMLFRFKFQIPVTCDAPRDKREQESKGGTEEIRFVVGSGRARVAYLFLLKANNK